ncbi:hypothetical protein KJ810_00315 [Patescibacteria group bacterium]|nr:hypothetical protein [Patescibacteria group bacterium]
MTLYRDIIKEAWQITWRRRFLWFFGLFAVLLGNGGEYEILFQNIDAVSNQQTLIYNLQNISNTGQLQTYWDNIASYFSNYTASSIGIFVLVLAIFVLIVWLVVISQAGLIDSTLKIKAGKKADLESGFQAGRKYFSPIFILNLISRVFVYTLLFLIGIPLVYLFLSKESLGWNIAFSIVSFIILVPISIIISFVIKYASAFVVHKGQGVGAALRNGWKLFIKNWLISIEMAFVVLLINFSLGLGLIIFLGIVAIPFVLLGIIFYLVGTSVGVYVLGVVATVVLIAAAFIVGAFIAAFQFVAWTLLYRRLLGDKDTSKIIRLFKRLPDYTRKPS